MTATQPTDAAQTEAVFGFDEGWSWSAEPLSCSSAGGSLEVSAPGGADLFAMPGAHEASGLPLLQRTVRGDFTAWTRISVDGAAFGDAGGIALHGPEGWLKVCVERVKAGGWAVVTVLSRPVSDEALGPALAGPEAELLVTREGPRQAVFFREAPEDDWRFVRTFFGFSEPELRLGLFVQAPFTPSASAVFAPVRFRATALPDRR